MSVEFGVIIHKCKQVLRPKKRQLLDWWMADRSILDFCFYRSEERDKSHKSLMMIMQNNPILLLSPSQGCREEDRDGREDWISILFLVLLPKRVLFMIFEENGTVDCRYNELRFYEYSHSEELYIYIIGMEKKLLSLLMISWSYDFSWKRYSTLSL